MFCQKCKPVEILVVKTDEFHFRCPRCKKEYTTFSRDKGYFPKMHSLGVVNFTGDYNAMKQETKKSDCCK